MKDSELFDKDYLVLTEVLRLVARRKFTEVTFVDNLRCQSEKPMISYGSTDKDYIVIIDGDTIVLTKGVPGSEEYSYRIK